MIPEKKGGQDLAKLQHDNEGTAGVALSYTVSLAASQGHAMALQCIATALYYIQLLLIWSLNKVFFVECCFVPRLIAPYNSSGPLLWSSIALPLQWFCAKVQG